MKLEIKRSFEIKYRLLDVEINEGGGYADYEGEFSSIEEAILYMEANNLNEENGWYLALEVEEKKG